MFLNLIPRCGKTRILPMVIHDISPLISEKLAVFPGDQPFERNVVLSFDKKDHLTLSSIQCTVHLGAHTDAPNHYHPSGSSIDQSSLETYFGPCQVLHVDLPRGSRIYPKDISGKEILAKRVLFKTNSFPDPQSWNGDFVALSSDLVEWLAERSVCLVGIDTPSVDLADDKILEAHTSIYKNKMSILEGIVLNKIPEGRYTLSALPLKIKDGDASPVRAVLIEGDLYGNN